MVNPIVEHMKARKRMMARVWALYDRVPPRRRKKAQRLIDEWHDGKISFQKLLRELERLAKG